MFNRILFIGAHTDDIELMCGGTICKFIESNCDIYYSTFSFANKSLPKGFDEGTTKYELLDSVKVLGIPNNNLFLYDYEVRVFDKYRQEILEDLIKLRNKIKPDLVITHNSDDTHQDHKVVSDESYRAFKQCSSIWGYESFKNNRVFKNDLYVKLNLNFIERKLEAISSYKSQIIKYDNRDAIKALAIFRGTQVNCDYAECFEAMRVII
jgi:LmbE family N-acetylglucosaminyl deacetylase